MIIQGLFDALYFLVDKLLGVMPQIDVSTFMGVWDNIDDIFKVVFYILPMGTVIQIFSIIVMLMTFRVTIAILKTIWGILPLV